MQTCRGQHTLSSTHMLRSLLACTSGTGTQVPIFLVPAVAERVPTRARAQCHRCPQQKRRLYIESTRAPRPGLEVLAPQSRPPTALTPTRALPPACHGCGALAQSDVPGEAGYYDLTRKAVKAYQGLLPREERKSSSRADAEATLRMLDQNALAKAGISLAELLPSKYSPDAVSPDQKKEIGDEVPLCDRCHDLIHNHRGVSIHHPSLEAIQETLEESPYKYNHVYHVLDAADFPMSLLPRIHTMLDSMPLRSRNRRSRAQKYQQGKNTEISFIITRADVLAPREEQVNRMLPVMMDILREALGKSGQNVRLGNVSLVSAKQAWWTKQLKEEVWNRRGGNWMIGKVNVGKSQLFRTIYPKGRTDRPEYRSQIISPRRTLQTETELVGNVEDLGDFALLPPAQKEQMYPQMPIVSALPGTTASPIRVPFGNGRGELIDMPGLARSELENYVLEEHRPSMILKERAKPEQQSLKHGKSLLLGGGLIRITPRTADVVFLAYNFTALESHLTANEKVEAIVNQTGEVNVPTIATSEAGRRLRLAGSFKLDTDVTKRYTGPVTDKKAIGIDVDRLPYKVLATDILIEGCGWVEVVAQVSKRSLGIEREPGGLAPVQPELTQPQASEKEHKTDAFNAFLDAFKGKAKSYEAPQPVVPKPMQNWSVKVEPKWPVIEVYSPEGRFVDSRQSLGAWQVNKPRKTAATRRGRPRKSMKGADKQRKAAKRAGR